MLLESRSPHLSNSKHNSSAERHLAALMLGLLALTPGCGSGWAAAVTGEESQSADPEPFTLLFSDTEPRLYSSQSDAEREADGENLARIRLPFAISINAGTFQIGDFRIERYGSSGVNAQHAEFVEPIGIVRAAAFIELVLRDPLALNGLYRIEVVGDVRDVRGLPLIGSKVGWVKIEPGEYEAVPEVVTFGSTALGGITVSGEGRAFAPLLATLSGADISLLGATSAPRHGTFGNLNVIYEGPDDAFAAIVGTPIVLNRSLALVPLREGDDQGISGDTVHTQSESIILKAFPGQIDTDGEIAWPEVTFSAATPEKFQVDNAAIGSPLDQKHMSFEGNYRLVDPSQLNGSSGVHVAAFWAWTREAPGGPEFRDYRVYANELSLDGPGADPDWGVAQALSGNDTSVAWPIMTSWESGRLAVIWNDAQDDANLATNIVGRQGVYSMEVPSYGLAIYDREAGGFQPTVEYNGPGVPLGRVTDIEATGADQLLLMIRRDRDLDPSPTQDRADERATIEAQVITINSSGGIDVALPPVPAPSTNPNGEFNNYMRFNAPLECTSCTNGLPAPIFYSQVGNFQFRGPKATHVGGDRYLITWDSNEIQSNGQLGDAELHVGMFEVDRNRWSANSFNLLSIVQLPPNTDLLFQQLRVDRFGYATLFWIELEANANTPPDAVRSLRSSISLLDVDFDAPPNSPTSLSMAFANEDPELIVGSMQLGSSNVSVYPVSLRISNTDDAGQFFAGWHNVRVESGVPGRIPVGADVRRFD